MATRRMRASRAGAVRSVREPRRRCPLRARAAQALSAPCASRAAAVRSVRSSSAAAVRCAREPRRRCPLRALEQRSRCPLRAGAAQPLSAAHARLEAVRCARPRIGATVRCAAPAACCCPVLLSGASPEGDLGRVGVCRCDKDTALNRLTATSSIRTTSVCGY